MKLDWHRRLHFPFSLLLFLVASAAGTGCRDDGSLQFRVEPALSVEAEFPLVARIEFETTQPSTARVTVREGDESRYIDFRDHRNQRHLLPILGLKPDRSYEIEVEILDQTGNPVQTRRLSHRTGRLPTDFPPISVNVSQPDRMEPGYTIFGTSNLSFEEGGKELHFTIVLDAAGEVVWYHQGRDTPGTPIARLNGKYLGMLHESEIVEYTLDGSSYRRWHAARFPNFGRELEVAGHSIPVDTETLHHDLTVLPSGNFLSLSTEVLAVDDFPSNPGDPASAREAASVISDIVIEFTPGGEIVRQWRLADLIDPARYGFDSGMTVWDSWGYKVEGGTRDWIHANAIAYWPPDDLVAVSLRNYDAVIGLRLGTGELVWIAGTPVGWGDPWKPFLLQPEGELEWPYHQHAVRFTPSGELLLFDNGNYRAWPPEPKMKPEDHYSRVVRYSIDATRRSIRQTWSYGGPEENRFFSSFVSEADLLPETGNLLVTDGGRTRGPGGEITLDPFNTGISARIFEIAGDARPETVFEVEVRDRSESKPLQWLVYRSERIRSLY